MRIGRGNQRATVDDNPGRSFARLCSTENCQSILMNVCMKSTVRFGWINRTSRTGQELLTQRNEPPTGNQWLPHRCRQGVVFSLLLLSMTTACALGPTASTAESRQPIRSPYPTFTPTAVTLASSDNAAPAATPVVNAVAPTATTADVATEAPTPTLPPPTAAPTVVPTAVPPRLVVNAPLANVRTGPGTTYTVVTTVERGQEYDIIGKNAAGDWWRFCCINDQPAWIINELVDVEGAIELAPVSEEVAQAPAATAAPAPTQPAVAATQPAAAPTQPPAAPAPDFAFELVSQEQFSEPKVVRVFLYVYDGEKALEGYTMRVKKDGADMTVNGKSAGGQPSFTWPIADQRQRFQNMKAEFPNVAPAGVWEVQLVDGGGNSVGPLATFTLNANDPNQELYVRYKKR